MNVTMTGYPKSHPVTKQEAQPQKVEQSATVVIIQLGLNLKNQMLRTPLSSA